MSLLAGFDLVTEISNETIRKLVLSSLNIGGVAAVPPFELTIPFSASGVSASAHLIVTDLQVDLNEGDTVSLLLSFNRTSVTATAPLSKVVCPLDGTLRVTAPIQLVSAGGSNQRVSVDMASATVAVTWSAAANQELTNDLAGTPLTPALFTTLATQALTTFVHTIAAPSIPLAFRVVPGTNGSLSPSIQFEKLEVHCIPNADRTKQALGLFGILLTANHANGNHSLKTATSITSAHDGVCISLSPGLFHSMAFCPAVAGALSTDVGHLPTTCGPAGGFNTQGITVRRIADSFANGHVDVDGSIAKSGTCYDATGSFHGEMTFTVSGSTLTPHLTVDSPDVDVDIPWYCWLAAGVVLGPIGIAIAAVVEHVAENMAEKLGNDLVQGALGSGLSGISLGGLSGASFSGVSVTTEGLTLQGSVPLSVPTSYVTPSLSLNGSVITTSQNAISSGNYTTKLWCFPEPKTYPYTEYAQQQTGSYQLRGQMVSQPLTPHFSIRAGSQVVSLNSGTGTVALQNVTTHYPMPLASGGTSLQQTVHITYAISGTTVQLTNVPSEGCYGVTLEATATDCCNAPVRGNLNQILTASTTLNFTGDYVNIGGTYQSDVQNCAHKMHDLLEKLLHERYIEANPKWPPIDHPGPDTIIRYIRDLVACGLPQADEILVISKIAHGDSYSRALSSPEARQPDLLRASETLAANQQRMTEMMDELQNFGQQLQGLGSKLRLRDQIRGGLRRMP